MSSRVFRAGEPAAEIDLRAAVTDLIAMVADRSPDFYEVSNGESVRSG